MDPFALSGLILLARAAACSTAVPQIPRAALVRQACSWDSAQAADVIVAALACIRSVVNQPGEEDRPKEAVTQSANHWRNDAAAALDLLYAADWSDFLDDAEVLDRSNKLAVQLADKMRATGHARGRAVVR